MPAPLLSIIFPAYNERSRLPGSLRRVAEYVGAKRLDAEIIVVDDGSGDGTADAAAGIARSADWTLPAGRFRILRNTENRGKGYSIRTGLLAAGGTWALFSDADLSTPIEDFERLYTRAIDGQLDIVIGSRSLPESNITLYQPFHRWFMGQTFNRIVRLMTGLPFHDTQCGFKLMVRERVRPLLERMFVDRFAFDVELLYLACRTGLSVAEEPVTWHNSPVSRVGLLGDPVNMLLDIARVTRRYRRGGYRDRREEPATGGEDGSRAQARSLAVHGDGGEERAAAAGRHGGGEPGTGRMKS